MNPKPIQFTSKKTSNFYPNYPIQLPSTMKKLRSNCYPTTIQLASNCHPIICYIAMEATAHRNRWLKWWFTVTTVFEMVIFHSYAQQSTIQLPSNSPVFFWWLEVARASMSWQNPPRSTSLHAEGCGEGAKAGKSLGTRSWSSWNYGGWPSNMWKPWDILYSNYLGQTMKVKACKKKVNLSKYREAAV